MGLFDWLKKKDKDVAENESFSESNKDESEETGVVGEDAADSEYESDMSSVNIDDLITDTNFFEENFIDASDKEFENVEADTIEDTEIQSEDSEENGEEESPVDEKPKGGFFTKLLAGLDKTRKNIVNGVNQVFGAFTKVDEELFEELEEALIMADIGVETTASIISVLRERVKKERITDVLEVKKLLVEEITKILEDGNEEVFEVKPPMVILVIGVNGVGKTTTIGKLANLFKNSGLKVTLAAADTFRAAAIDQLEVWSKRAEVDLIKHQESSDPAAVVYDAVQSAKARKSDVLICDTAGRMHNKKNLMEELRKINKIINRDYPDANKEVFLVLDATTGQNALQQAKTFKDIADITGIVLTKLDGTAKGGIVISIKSQLKIPVRFICIGEKVNDMQPFNAKDFARAIFDENY